MDAFTFPTIELGGKQYEIKFRIGDLKRLQKNHNVDVFAGGMEPLKGVEAVDRSLLLLQHGLAHAQEFTAEQLSDLIVFQDFPAMIVAVSEALSKVRPQPVATPPTTPAAIQ